MSRAVREVNGTAVSKAAEMPLAHASTVLLVLMITVKEKAEMQGKGTQLGPSPSPPVFLALHSIRMDRSC